MALTIFGVLAISSSVNADVNNNELPANNQQVVQNAPQLKTQQVATDNNDVTNQTSGWQNKDGDWYYYQNGQAQTGWQNVSNNWYYLNPETNVMETGLQKIKDNTYYLNDLNFKNKLATKLK